MGAKHGIIFTSLVIIFLYYAPNLPPHAEFNVIEVTKGGPLEGPLSPNTFLNNAERLHENVLLGPESIAVRSSDEIFVGVFGGDIVKVYGKNFEKTKVVANNGPGCAGYWEEHICGRPLGIRFHTNGLLYVADSYLGVFAVDVDTGKSTNVFNISEPIDGILPRLTDDLDFDKQGNIYWSDASSVCGLSNGVLELYSSPSGRLFKYDILTKKHEVLLDKIHFANGVQLSPNKDFVLVNEFAQKRTLRYWLEGPKAGTSEIFVSNLPGMPDNIRPRPHGGYYIAILFIDEGFHHTVVSFLGSRPTLKRFLCRVAAMASSVAQLIDNVLPNSYCKSFVHQIFGFSTFARWVKNHRTVIVEADKDGNIIGSMQGSNGQLTQISEVQKIGDNIIFGSPFNSFLGRINIKDTPKPKTKVDREDSYDKYEL